MERIFYLYFSTSQRDDMWVEKIIMMFIRFVGTVGAEEKLHYFLKVYAAVTPSTTLRTAKTNRHQ